MTKTTDGKVYIVTLTGSQLQTLKDLCKDALRGHSYTQGLMDRDKQRVRNAELALEGARG